MLKLNMHLMVAKQTLMFAGTLELIPALIMQSKQNYFKKLFLNNSFRVSYLGKEEVRDKNEDATVTPRYVSSEL